MTTSSAPRSTAQRPHVAAVIMKRELGAYFSGPIAYIVTGLFLLLSGILFFSVFFLQDRAELRRFFDNLPILLSFFIPALTMRLFAEEKRSGTIETLMTLPVTELDVVWGKFAAAWISAIAMLAPTVSYVVTVALFGRPDPGPIVGGYLGALFLCAAFSAIGLFASSVTKNQIIAFFIAFGISIVLSTMDYFLIFLPGTVVHFLSYFSAGAHFSSISRGILDTRDLLYFVSVTLLFLVLTVEVEQRERR
jgi:ABC-2 type transport system permease protein